MASNFQTRAPFAKVPAATSSQPSRDKYPHKLIPNGIEIQDWVIQQKIGPMLNSEECDSLSAELNLPSLPEMVFGKNGFELMDKKSGLKLEFSTVEALRQVLHTSPTDIKVAASTVWSESNKSQVEKLKAEKEFSEDSAHQNFDWTFTTRYSGTISAFDANGNLITTYAPTVIATGLDPVRDAIPMDKLRSTSEPILWFSQVPLFEDELHDNGIADFSTKARIMGTFWFALVRFWLRVDGVMFRVIDHRLYHEFGSPHIIRETSTKEGTWAEVNKKVEGDLRKIRDPSEFAMYLQTISTSLEHIMLPTRS